MRPFILFITTIFFFATAIGQAKIAFGPGISNVLNPKRTFGKDFVQHKDQLYPTPSFNIHYLRNADNRISYMASTGFITKGFFRQSMIVDATYNTKVKVNYLWFSLQATLKVLDKEDRSLFFALGPYVAAALSGHETGVWYSIAGGPIDYDKKISITRSKTDGYDHQVAVSPTDIGINSSVFYQTKKYGLMLSWQKGLKNIISYVFLISPPPEYKNSTLDLSLFYQFDLSAHKTKKTTVKCPAVSTPPKQ